MKLLDRLDKLKNKLFGGGKAISKARWIVLFTGDNRKVRRALRRKTLNRILQEFRGKGEGTRLARTLEPAAVAKALKKHIRDQEAIAKLRKARGALDGATV